MKVEITGVTTYYSVVDGKKEYVVSEMHDSNTDSTTYTVLDEDGSTVEMMGLRVRLLQAIDQKHQEKKFEENDE